MPTEPAAAPAEPAKRIEVVIAWSVPRVTQMARTSKVAVLLLAIVLAGCAGTLPPHREQHPSLTLVAGPGAPLAEVASRAGIAPDESGAWPMPQGAFALDARVAAIAAATRSVDVQTYLLGDDEIGHLMLGALAKAAARGVRVRLLVDDIYTTGLDPLLLGLAAHPNAEVRLFNPFVRGRASSFGRLLAFAGDFERLDHRMHNKLFIADGQVAIMGGRNMADDYFVRGMMGNFFDIDFVLVGSVVPSLSRLFDRYWNSPRVYDVGEIAERPPGAGSDDDLLQSFERRTAIESPPVPPPADLYGAAPFSAQLATGQFRLIALRAISVHADMPDKMRPMPGVDDDDTVSRRLSERLGEARSEAVIISPYFIPDARVKEKLRTLRAEGVSIRVITNSLAVSDEPQSSIALERHQRDLLGIGVDLYELSSSQVNTDSHLRSLVGSSIGRLHAKLAVIDRHVVLAGSVNLDSRSANINTEVGFRLDSDSVASMLFAAYRIEQAAGVYQVKLLPDGQTIGWSIRGADGKEVMLTEEPDSNGWYRLRQRVLSWFVPEREL
jgi:phosphatidylserine/phosphatidylglycerophosphate/cardiolipin synthase-like enzyme